MFFLIQFLFKKFHTIPDENLNKIIHYFQKLDYDKCLNIILNQLF